MFINQFSLKPSRHQPARHNAMFYAHYLIQNLYDHPLWRKTIFDFIFVTGLLVEELALLQETKNWADVAHWCRVSVLGLMKLTHKRLGNFPAVRRPLSSVTVSPLYVVRVGVEVTDFLDPKVARLAAGLHVPGDMVHIRPDCTLPADDRRCTKNGACTVYDPSCTLMLDNQNKMLFS